MSEEYIVIEGVNEEGERFRPSDWSERIAAMIAGFKRGRLLAYDARLHPLWRNGVKGLRVDCQLAHSEPKVWQHVIEFARSNRLQIDDAHCR